jgi:exodeoxyribonuclease V beta subunit
MKEFEIFSSPLSGTNLIEASAGTGKTYAISMIFLRLIVEKGFRLEEILAVTFTVPATMELRQRIRSVLRDASDVLAGGDAADSKVQLYMENYRGNNAVMQRIITALKSFDEASVYTIHSFCQQVLSDNAFESGSLFSSEIINDDEIIRQAAADFCRRELYENSVAVVAFFMEYCGFDELIGLYKKRPLSPELRLEPQTEIPGTEIAGTLFKEIRELYSELAKAWLSHSHDVEDILNNSEALNRARYRKESMDSLIESMNIYISAGNPLAIGKAFGKDKFRNFTPEKITGSTKKGYDPPGSPVFELCGRLGKAFDEYIKAGNAFLVNMKKELFTYIDRCLLERKSLSSRRTYDDLIRDVHRGIGASRLLAKKMNARYRAALIDEFQDTDDLQFEIFNSLFNTGSTILFLIGDPKQAIYRFRGADIFSYLRASGLMSERYTLTRNWRSSPGLIDAINLIFGQCTNPFIFERISYHTISAGDEKQDKRFMKNGEPLPFLDIWLGTGDEVTSRKTGVLLRELASEISLIISRGSDNPYSIDGRRINPGDIAVLVRTRNQVMAVRDALALYNIPSASRAMESVFTTDEAVYMYLIVSAVAEPSNYRAVRAAASTPVLGMTAGDIYTSGSVSGSGIDALTSRLYDYREEWISSGFIAMFSMFLEGESVPARIFSMKGGERMMTDLNHLAEILHNAEHEKGCTPGELAAWFAAAITSPPGDGTDEKYSMRIERDDEAVNIITMHSCKGLEFPLVYCPFPAHVTAGRNDYTVYHDPESTMPVLFLDRDIPPEVKKIKDSEDLAENVRLLYVALTRAKYRCRIMFAPNNRFPVTAAYYIFVKGRGYTGISDEPKFTAEILALALERLAQDSQGCIRFSRDAGAEGVMYRSEEQFRDIMSVKDFSGEIKESWRTLSYSAIAHGSEQRKTEDKDFMSEFHPKVEARSGIFAFPSGPRAGLCIHEIFERNDFSIIDRDPVKESCREVLRKYRFEDSWDRDLADMFFNVTSTVLDPCSGLRLADIASGSRLAELEFDFPVKLFDSASFREVFSISNVYCSLIYKNLSLSGAKTAAMMKGFIDLVFTDGNRYYIADWKSNHLGNSCMDYSPERILCEMERHNYFLQYHLYTLALHRYLKQRMGALYNYEKHFGGIYYLFVRGVDPGAGTGVFTDRPGIGIIERLDRYFKGRET